MRLWPGSTRNRVLLIAVVVLLVGGATSVGIFVFNIGQTSTYVATSNASSAATTTSEATTSTAAAPSGRTGSFAVANSGGDRVLVTVTIGETARADQTTVAGQSLTGRCGIDGMASTRASATKVSLSLELKSRVAVTGDIKFQTRGALYAAKYRDGWSCRSGALVVNGYIGVKLEPGRPSTFEGWWVMEQAITNGDPTGSRTNVFIDVDTPVGRSGTLTSEVSGDVMIRCGNSIYLRVSGNSCQ